MITSTRPSTLWGAGLVLVLVVLFPIISLGGEKKKPSKASFLSIPFTLQGERKEFDWKAQRAGLFGNSSIESPHLTLYGDTLLVWFRAGDKGSSSKGFPLRAVYGEGHLFLQNRPHFIQGKRIFYDFVKDRGFVEEGTIHIVPSQVEKTQKLFDSLGIRLPSAPKADLQVPLYLRAKRIEIANLLQGPLKIKARSPKVTTCNFNRPHYHLSSSLLTLEEYHREAQKRYIIYMEDMTFKVKNSPLFYFPYFYWDTTWNPFVPRVKIGNSSQFGKFALLEFRFPTWLTFNLKTEILLDFYEDRGVGTGGRVWYGDKKRFHRPFWAHQIGQKDSNLPWWKRYYGIVDGYTIHDQENSRQDRSGFTFQDRQRFWAKILHQHRLPGDIKMTGEYQKYSDGGFRLEYNEREAKTGKDIENYLYFQKNHNTWGATLTAKFRQNDFLEENEELPSLKWFLQGYPLFVFPRSTLYFDFEGEGGYFRHYEPGRLAPEADVLRVDQQATLSYPFFISHFRFRPYFQSRISGYSETLNQDRPRERISMEVGNSLTLHLSRVFHVQIPWLAIKGLKHTIDPEIRYANIFLNTLSPGELFIFDDTDRVQKGSFFRLDLRNRLFTRRRGEIVRIFEANAFARFYPRREDNGEIPLKEFGFLFFEGLALVGDNLKWEPWEGTEIFKGASLGVQGDVQYHPYRGRLEEWNLGVVFQDLNRFSLLFSYRFQENISEVVTFDLGVKLNEKWGVRAFYQYDLNRDELIQQSYYLRRKVHHWYLIFKFKTDEGLDDTSFSINFAPIFLKESREFFSFERSNTYDPEIRHLPGF